MKIRIEIEFDNAAFEHAPEHETARILTWFCKELRGHGMKLLAGGHKLRDVNGNTVGKAEIVDETETRRNHNTFERYVISEDGKMYVERPDLPEEQ